MPPSGSPTVRRRRLAAELRRLRGNRKAGEVAHAIGWSPSKISRAESGRESLPPEEIEKLIDFYGATEPLRRQLLEFAGDAVRRGWWEDYADTLAPEYMEFIGLEAEAASCLQWQPNVVPGLLQTEDYARQINVAFQAVNPTVSPSVQERFLKVRMLRQARLTEEPALQFSAVLDEAVLMRSVGSRDVMRAQLARLVEAADLPNVDLRILPLNQNGGLQGSPFALMSFDSQGVAGSDLEDIVSIEVLHTELYEADTHLYRLFFEALSQAALLPAESRHLVISVMDRAWRLPPR